MSTTNVNSVARGSGTVLGLVLRPLDVLFFRDGRPMIGGWHPVSGLPNPQILAGALRTWLLSKVGCDFDRLAERVRKHNEPLEEALSHGQPAEARQVFELKFRGPWLARKEEEGKWGPLVPVPANLYWPKTEAASQVLRADPLSSEIRLPGWKPPAEELLPLWVRDSRPLARADGFLTLRGLQQFLAGGCPEENEIVPKKRLSELFDYDHRVGIEVDPETGAVKESQIYGAGYLALREGVGFYAEVEDPGGSATSLLQELTAGAVVTFGGNGKRAAVEQVDRVIWPEVSQPGDGRGVMLLVTTPLPARSDSGGSPWCPDKLAGSLLSAAVPGYRAVSGWDLARGGPKPTRFLLEPGSVYFLRPGVSAPDGWSLADEEDAQLGWGHFVKGVWKNV